VQRAVRSATVHYTSGTNNNHNNNSNNSSSSIRKPRTGYIFFRDYVRPLLQKEQPHLKLPQMLKELGARWSSLSGKDKAPFIEQADDDRLRFV
jgi:hypothetical protein